MRWTVEFYEDEQGRSPAREFLLGLPFEKRAAAIAAIEKVLAPMGLDVCKSEYGTPLGNGLHEFRLRHDERTILAKANETVDDDASTGEVLLRLFFAAYGERIILLLGGYDKGRDSSQRRQTKEIERARRSLRSFNLRLQRQKAAARRAR